jgi:uncharacterized protein YggE
MFKYLHILPILNQKEEFKMEEKKCCGKHGIMHFIIALGIIAIAVMLFRPSGQKQNITIDSSNAMDAISVSGESQIEVMPDKAMVYVSIVANSTSAKEAKDEAATIFANVKAELIKAGVDTKSIESDSYSITPMYEWNKDFQRSDFTGYQVTHTLKITTTVIDKTGDIIDAAVNSGANQVDRVVFDLSKNLEKETYSEALTQSASLAKAKAASIADALGVKLGKIKTVTESSGYYTPYVNYYRNDFSGAAEAMKSSEIMPQKLTVTGMLSVSYYIE